MVFGLSYSNIHDHTTALRSHAEGNSRGEHSVNQILKSNSGDVSVKKSGRPKLLKDTGVKKVVQATLDCC